ncbi:MAG: serine protease [Candidatus Moranbacteria bacterium]|nr:serine protease [Candidatus Moranbacteria bacterium]
MGNFKKILLVCLLIFAVFVVGGIGGIVIRDRFIPYLVSSFPAVARSDFLRSLQGNVTVVERTEQMVVREDDSVDAIVSQPSTAVVNIIPSGDGEDAKNRTGVLLTNDGLIVTSGTLSVPERKPGSITYHALLHDGTSQEAVLVGEDPLTDLVFFRIQGNAFPAIAIANSDDSTPGKKLVAIGNAYEEYQNRFSIGVLSNLNKLFNLSGKTVASSEKWEGVFEADLANAGAYVGGPAVNFRGEMIGLFGIVVMDGQEKPYLLPSNEVRESMQRAVAGTLVTRPVLGVYYRTLTKAYAIAGGDGTRDRGALVFSPSGKTGLTVLSGSPADKAGIRFGDIIIAVNGSEINLDNPLSVAIGRLSKGEKLQLTVIRDGKETNVSVQL